MVGFFGNYFGACRTGDGGTGTLGCDMPADADVRAGIVYGWGSDVGVLELPDESDVLRGVGYGANGTEFEGSRICPSPVSDASVVHSPAQIIQQLLIDLGLGSQHPLTPWPVFATAEPNTPDEVITVRDTGGRDQGRIQFTGERIENPGIQIRVRANNHPTGWSKAKEIANALDQRVLGTDEVDLGVKRYLINNVSRTGTILPIGKAPESNRLLFTFNALVTITDISSGT